MLVTVIVALLPSSVVVTVDAGSVMTLVWIIVSVSVCVLTTNCVFILVLVVVLNLVRMCVTSTVSVMVFTWRSLVNEVSEKRQVAAGQVVGDGTH